MDTCTYNNDITMGDIKQQAAEIWQGLGKAITTILLILLSVMAKLAADSRIQRLTRRDIIIKTVLSVFVGALASIICEVLKTKWGRVVVPVCTLLGESMVVYVMTNWKPIAEKYFPWAFPKKK